MDLLLPRVSHSTTFFSTLPRPLPSSRRARRSRRSATSTRRRYSRRRTAPPRWSPSECLRIEQVPCLCCPQRLRFLSTVAESVPPIHFHSPLHSTRLFTSIPTMFAFVHVCALHAPLHVPSRHDHFFFACASVNDVSTPLTELLSSACAATFSAATATATACCTRFVVVCVCQ